MTFGIADKAVAIGTSKIRCVDRDAPLKHNRGFKRKSGTWYRWRNSRYILREASANDTKDFVQLTEQDTAQNQPSINLGCTSSKSFVLQLEVEGSSKTATTAQTPVIEARQQSPIRKKRKVSAEIPRQFSIASNIDRIVPSQFEGDNVELSDCSESEEGQDTASFSLFDFEDSDVDVEDTASLISAQSSTSKITDVLPVGFFTWSLSCRQGEVDLKYLHVDSEHRRKGLASAMILEVERQLRELRCSYLNINVKSSNVPAMLFAQKAGFQLAACQPNSPNGTLLYQKALL